MGCQKEIAQGILEREADYLLAVKKNQGRLYEDLRDLFEGAEEAGFDGVPQTMPPHSTRVTGALSGGSAGRSATRAVWNI